MRADDRRDRARSTTRACTAARRLADGLRRVRRRRDPVPVPRAGRYALDGRLVDVPDRDEFAGLPDDLALAAGAGRDAGAASCSSTSIPTPSRCSTSSIRCPTLLAPYHLDEMRLPRRTARTIIDANWKAVVDAFNEGYHVQGLHPQILPWTDDVEHRVRAVRAARALRPAARRAARAAAEPAPRARAPTSTTRARSSRALVAGLGGAFLGEERAAVDELRATGPPAGLDAARGVPGAAHGRCSRRAASTSRASRPS